MRVRRALVLVATAAALVVPSAVAAESPLADAAAKTFSGQSLRYSLVLGIGGTGSGLAATAVGEAEAGGKRSHMTLDLSKLGALLGGAGRPADFKGDVVVDSTKAPVVYIRLPFLQHSVGARKPWVRVTAAAGTTAAGINLSQLGAGDPGQQRTLLGAVAGKPTEVGEDEVRGVTTTHYRATLALAKLPADTRRQLRKLVGASTLPVDVWIDGDGLVRRLAVVYGRGLTSTRIVSEYYDFGAAVRVTVPPAAKTTTLKQ
jgi:hypothetical protein